MKINLRGGGDIASNKTRERCREITKHSLNLTDYLRYMGSIDSAFDSPEEIAELKRRCYIPPVMSEAHE